MRSKLSPLKYLLKKIKNKYRLVILNEDTLEELLSLLLSPMNLFVIGGLTIIFSVVSTIIIIAFTPIREYIPGYSDERTKQNAIYALEKVDSLEKVYYQYELYIQNIKAIGSGDSLPSNTIAAGNKADYSNIQIKASKEDSLFRKKIKEEDKYNLQMKSQGISSTVLANNYLLYPPVEGRISEDFNYNKGHFGIDIVPNKENEMVKTVMDGTVVLANWTNETGYVIQIQHKDDFISIYKHNASLLKKIGEKIKTGEAIAIAGNTGSLSSGPHLHFELWHKGIAVDPKNYILF